MNILLISVAIAIIIGIITLIHILTNTREFVIFSNPHYSGAWSVTHKGGYIYINFNGSPGLSYDQSRCASISTREDCLVLIRDWVARTYGVEHEYMVKNSRGRTILRTNII